MTLQTHNISYWLELAEQALANITSVEVNYDDSMDNPIVGFRLSKLHKAIQVIEDTITFINNIKDDSSAILHIDAEQVNTIVEWGEK